MKCEAYNVAVPCTVRYKGVPATAKRIRNPLQWLNNFEIATLVPYQLDASLSSTGAGLARNDGGRQGAVMLRRKR